MGLLHVCNTARNIAQNIAVIVKTLLGMTWGSCDSCYRIADTSCHQVCASLSNQSLPLPSSKEQPLVYSHFVLSTKPPIPCPHI